MDNVDKVTPSIHYLQPPLLAFNRQGRFEAGDPGTTKPVAARGAAFGDIDNDGWIDVMETAYDEHPALFKNRGGSAHWLTISLRGTKSNRDGYGARVHVNGQSQYANAGGSYLSSSDKRVHFGLGSAKMADVEILWPSGIHQVLKGIQADQILEVREPEKP